MSLLRSTFSQAQITVGDSQDMILDAATVSALKSNFQGKYDALAAQVKTEVAGW